MFIIKIFKRLYITLNYYISVVLDENNVLKNLTLLRTINER